jgi:hypothetical protein
MDHRLKIGLILSIITIAAVLTAALTLTAQHPPFIGPDQRRSQIIQDDFEIFYLTFTVISAINIALLVILVVTYASIYNKTRSPFSIGLVIFAGVFLIKDVTENPLVIGVFRFQASGLGPFAFLPSVFELVALSVLLYLSIKY